MEMLFCSINTFKLKKEKPSKESLIELYDLSFQIIKELLEKLDESDLDKATEIPNPAAKTKYQALMCLFQQQSWHNGQTAILKRVLNKKTA